MTIQEAIAYLNSLTRFVFEQDALTRIAYEQRVMDYHDMAEVPEETKDYCLISLYEMVVNGPWSVASSSLQHGNFRQDIGSETVTSAVIDNIKEKLKLLYKKYGLTDEADSVDSSSTVWVNELDC